MADTYTTVRAQRSKYFGAANGYVFRGNGATVNNLNSDFFFQQIMDDKRVEKLVKAKGPGSPEARDPAVCPGYVAGYNR